MKTKNLIIPTLAARHLFTNGSVLHDIAGTRVVLPTPNKDGRYRFPDGEVYLRIPGLGGAKEIIIVHAGHPDTNDGLIELYMVLDIIDQYSPAAEVKVLFTEMPYARQDNAYYQGELNAAFRLITNLTGRYRVKHVATIDAHFAHKQWARGIKTFSNVSPLPLLMEAAQKDYPDIIFIAPDAGSTRRAHIQGATKRRLNSYEVNLRLNENFAARIRGKVIGVVDDILATGTTMERIHGEAKRFGARKVVGLISHGVNEHGIDRTLSRYDALYMTNSIKRAEANVCIKPLIKETIERMLA